MKMKISLTVGHRHDPVLLGVVRRLELQRLRRAQDEGDHEEGDPQGLQVLLVVLVVADQLVPGNEERASKKKKLNSFC